MAVPVMLAPQNAARPMGPRTPAVLGSMAVARTPICRCGNAHFVPVVTIVAHDALLGEGRATPFCSMRCFRRFTDTSPATSATSSGQQSRATSPPASTDSSAAASPTRPRFIAGLSESPRSKPDHLLLFAF